PVNQDRVELLKLARGAGDATGGIHVEDENLEAILDELAQIRRRNFSKIPIRDECFPRRLRFLERTPFRQRQSLRKRIERLALYFAEAAECADPLPCLGLEFVERSGRSPDCPPRERSFANQRKGVSKIFQLFVEGLDQLHQLLGGQLALACFDVGKRLAIIQTQLGSQFVLAQVRIFSGEFHPL